MTVIKALAPMACIAMFGLTSPSYAGQRGGHGGGGHGGDGHAAAGHAGGGGRVSGGGAYRGSVSRGWSGGGAVRGGAVAPGGYAMARTAPAYRGGAVVRGGYGGGGFYRGGGGFYRGGGGFYRSGGFYRPYYTFRPRLSLGFGLWLGYPVAWPSFYDDYPYYDYPYAAPYPYPYGYGSVAPSYGYSYPAQPYGPAPNSTYAPGYQTPPPSAGVQPGIQPSAQGGVSFQITPDSAAVLVDGTYVGTVGMFGPTSQPLGLAPGRHHIEIRADGYRPMTFDADITPGQVMPYQGAMER